MKKRVGIILDSQSVSKQIKDFIQSSNKSSNYEITTLIINQIDKNKHNLFSRITSSIIRRGIIKFLSNALFMAICKLEVIFVKRYEKFSKFYEKYQLNEENFQVIGVNPSISKNGFIYRYEKFDLELIRNANLDLLIRAGSGILKGEILNVCPNGVISFHHADNDINRGGPPGFWEVYEKNPRTGFIIQRLKEELDGGDVLYKGFIATRWFYSLNVANLYEVANPFLHHVIEDITSDKPKLTIKNKSPYSFPLYTAPNIFQSLFYLLKNSLILINKIFNKITRKFYRWGIAYQFVNNWWDVTLWRSKKIPNPKHRFLADPFVIKKNGEHYCFVEDYNYKTHKGSISAYKINLAGYEDLGIVLEEDFHLSYPFIFEYENQLYMCPDTHEKKEIRIYKCVEFPHRWSFHKTIMKNISAVDTSIFKYDNKWWLFTNIDQSIVGDHSCQLYIFHSSNPFTEDWTPHATNPVIFDPLIARNGGLIIDNNNMYRVFQQQGFDRYGKGLGIAKICTLTSTEYDEKIISKVEARFFPSIIAAHTYNFNNGLLVIDFAEITNVNNGRSK